MLPIFDILVEVQVNKARSVNQKDPTTNVDWLIFLYPFYVFKILGKCVSSPARTPATSDLL